MFETKYSNFLTILLIVIIIAVIGLLGYVGYNVYKNHSIQKGASEYVEAFVGETEVEKNTSVTNTANVTNETNTTEETNEVEQNTSIEDVNIIAEGQTTKNTTTTKRTTQYKGFDTVGTIQIKAINLNYPVLAKTTKKSLETSVAVLYPDNAELNKEGNVVIVGHNYRNGTFFSNNKKLKIGDEINLTDLYGKKITYVIYNIFEANQNDTSFYNRDTNGAKEVTLSTCTDASNDMRLIVLAKEK